MNEQECEVCTKLVKEKYKYHNTWKVLAIVFMCLTVLFAILFFASGDLLSSTTIEYNNEVEIKNEGDYNTNTDNGNIIVEKKNDSTGSVLILCTVLLVGGIIGGCYIVSQISHNNKQ
jgi:hypothetical protein